jgi:hypothetical protein
MEPQELFNRWIVPLESRVDFLTLWSGKKIKVPFEQLIIFSTNLEPSDLVDEAFLRRIPYKIEIRDPTPKEFHVLFQIYCTRFDCDYQADVVDYLLNTHFIRAKRGFDAVILAICQVRFAAIARTTNVRWNCDPNTSIVLSKATSLAF